MHACTVEAPRVLARLRSSALGLLSSRSRLAAMPLPILELPPEVLSCVLREMHYRAVARFARASRACKAAAMPDALRAAVMSEVARRADFQGVSNFMQSACRAYPHMELPFGPVRIFASCFFDCSSLISITLPDRITSIGNCCFHKCSSLTTVTLPAGLERLGGGTFAHCSSLTSVDLPARLTCIGDTVFHSCASLVSVTLPPALTSIGPHAFYGCSALSSISVPPSLTSIGGSAFGSCFSLDAPSRQAIRAIDAYVIF